MPEICIPLSDSDVSRKKILGKEVTWPKIIKRGLANYEYDKRKKESSVKSK